MAFVLVFLSKSNPRLAETPKFYPAFHLGIYFLDFFTLNAGGILQVELRELATSFPGTGLNNVCACARSHGSLPPTAWAPITNLEKMAAFLKVSYGARFVVKR